MVKLNPIIKMRYNIAHGLVTAAQNAPHALKGSGNPWREAASLLLVSPTPAPESKSSSSDKKPHFLVTKRSKTSGAFSSILCFPGGNTCMADTDPKWIHKYGCATGYSLEDGISFISSNAESPKIYGDRSTQKMPTNRPFTAKTQLPKEVSLRITAVRETFEETGILLCKPNDIKKYYQQGLGRDAKFGVGYESNVEVFDNLEEVKKWQSLVRRNPVYFMEMCYEKNCLPDVNALVEWNNYLTPNCFGMQRYDTIFYMALIPKTYPMSLCPQEVESASWQTAEEVLKDCEEEKNKMITPQIYELTRLKAASMSMLKQLMKIRLSLGIERWCPAYIRAKDGYLSVFPGDDLYPENIKIDIYEPIPSLDSTLDELRETSFRQHRIEYRSEFDFKMVIKNYKERFGHIYLD